ncbi:MAG: hypothetical protein NC095_09935 [Muribaculum sp.]|nr:hypothetical protein [Muribaculum sp.]
MNEYNTAGPGSIIASAAVAIAMIAATALFLPSIHPGAEYGICFSFPDQWFPHIKSIAINTFLIVVAVMSAFLLNKKYSFVKGADMVLPVAMSVLLASNPVNTSCFSTPVIMLIVNLICLDIMMKSYCSSNATTQMFAVATYLSVGSMIEYGFLPLMLVYPAMAVMTKVFRIKELLAYLMGIVAPYWVGMGFGIISLADFRVPEFLSVLPAPSDSDYLLMVYVSLAIMALVGLMMTLNNALLFYSGNIRVRTFNNIINLLGISCTIFMLVDFNNFEAYTSTFCFAVSVQTANFFAIRRIPHSDRWFWGLLSIFIGIFLLMLLESLT